MANNIEKPKEFLIYPRDLAIEWSENSKYWSWRPVPNETPSETLVEVAVLEAVCWLHVNGKFNTSELTPETMYEVVYVVKLEELASGWETLVTLKLDLPNGASPQERNVSLEEHIGHGWVDKPAGEFMTSPENIGEINFSMFETASNWWKQGLVVKGVAIRPKI